MHEMQTIVTNVHGVCLSVRLSVCLSVCHAGAQLGFTVWGSFGAAIAKSLWPLFITSCSVSLFELCGLLSFAVVV